MSQMTKSTLLHIDSGGGGSANFAQAGVDANNALVTLEDLVWRPLMGRASWDGVGQADAESVVHTNVLALNIGKAMLEAGAVAMRAATSGFSALQVNLDRLNVYAKSMGCWVNEDGTVVWDEHNPHKPIEIYDADTVKQTNLQLAVQQTLKLATALDLSTTASLQVVYDHAPEVVDNAADAAKALPKNKQTLVGALDSRESVLEMAAGWSLVGDSLLGVADLQAAGTNPLPDGVAKQVLQLDDLLEDVAALTPAGPLLDALKGDVPALLVDGIAVELEAIGKGATVVGDELLAKVAGLSARLVGTGVNVAILLMDLVAALAPEGYPTTHPVVDHNGEVKGNVNDFELSHIAAHYYDNFGYDGGALSDATVADMARAQQLGATGPAPVDYVQEATQVRDDLRDWLNRHKDLSFDDPDRRYAEGLLADLDAAIDGPKTEDEMPL